ncbi:MAG: lipoyl synthase [Bacteroidales bacterium]|nr:lipoyl synthase [Bacteroidales bacterium]
MKTINNNKPKIQLRLNNKYIKTKNITEKYLLNTICKSSNCPNHQECWKIGTATFMILGEVCTRFCKFCSVKHGKAQPPDNEEPKRIAISVKLLNIKYVVITSVSRDDLFDHGANHWKNTIHEVKKINPNVKIEVLIPDFLGKTQLLDIVLNANPDIVAHNIETVARLTPTIRSNAKYERSLTILKYIAQQGFITKSGFMVGLGETEDEIIETIKDLYNAGCKILTIGQYLQPSLKNVEVCKYYNENDFNKFKEIAYSLGFKYVESGKLVRSSYHAKDIAEKLI